MPLMDRVKHHGKRLLAFALLDAKTRGVIEDRLTYLRPQRLYRLCRALRRTKNVCGDYLEFGVALGGSGIIIAQNLGRSSRFLGFDVFGMIPPPTSEQDSEESKNRYETIRSGAAVGLAGGKYYGYRENLYDEVKQSFSRHGVPVDEISVRLYRGRFEETWPNAEVTAIAFAHIDCDWYDPVRFCLNAIADKLSPGAVVVIDDYHDYAGCRRAVDEFMQQRNDFAFEEGDNPYLLKR